MIVQLLLLHVDYYWVRQKTLHRLCPHRSHVVSSRKAPFNCNNLAVSSFSLNWFDTTALGIYGFSKPVQSLIKPVCFALGLYEALLGLLNPVDNEVRCLDLQFYLEAFEFMMIFCSLRTTKYYTFICYTSSPRPPLPSLSCLTIPQKQDMKRHQKSHKKFSE